MVATVMSNLGLERALAARGGKLVRTAVGDRYVVEAMREQRLQASAASSRATSSSSTTRPPATASSAALRVLAVMVAGAASRCRSWRATMTRYPQVLLNFAVAREAPARGAADGAEG